MRIVHALHADLADQQLLAVTAGPLATPFSINTYAYNRHGDNPALNVDKAGPKFIYFRFLAIIEWSACVTRREMGSKRSKKVSPDCEDVMISDRVLLDIESQRDFFSPGGAMYRPESAGVYRKISRLFSWARANKIPVISTLLRLRPGQRGQLSSIPYCVDDTEGEGKMPRTVLARRVNLGLLNTTDLPDHIFQDYQQVVFEKRDSDIFAHARIERLITELPPCTFVLCGAGISAGIYQAAVGLRSRGFPVVLASDAALTVNAEQARMAHLRMEAKGVVYAPTESIIAPVAKPRRLSFRSSPRLERQAF